MIPDTGYETLDPMAQYNEFRRLMPGGIREWRDAARSERRIGDETKALWESAVVSWWHRVGDDDPYRDFMDDLVAKPGVDKTAAQRHIRHISRSMQPRHEHKLAAIAMLAMEWFERPDFERYRNAQRERWEAARAARAKETSCRGS